MIKYVLFFVVSFPVFLFAQEKKSLEIDSTQEQPKIDGLLTEDSWVNAKTATGFVMLEPGSGTKEPENQKSIVKVTYDDDAIYIGALLYDDDPKNIPMQFSSRDNFAQSDSFSVHINPNNDGVNDTYFIVTSSGTQIDAKVSKDNVDFSWSSVWESAVSINTNSWSVEIKIPYAALRFSKNNTADWGINFLRSIQNKKEKYSWNFIDKTNGNIAEYSGLLTGIENIDPPIRLSFYPYTQGTVTHYNGDLDWRGTAGLDVKYGISESFTLDATLIPDFGQTAFDDVVINLGPFEQHYEEKRAFFTEGTELFEKGDLFYSRRIGGVPINYSDIETLASENDRIINNPEKTKLINAIKISGRTKNGFGLGVFNAITSPTRATIYNTETDQERKVITNPLTNYSVIVADQQFNKTSSIGIINTSVLRKGENYDANVTSLIADLRTKNNKFALKTDLSMSNLYENSILDSGFRGKLYLGKVSGAHRFGTDISISDNTYDKSDLGYQDYNNYVNYELNYSYRIFEPKGNLNRFHLYSWIYLNYVNNPYTYADNGSGLSMLFTNNKQLSYGTNLNFHFGYENDYYEPRVTGRFYKKKQVQFFNAWLSTDYNKKMAFDTRVSFASQFGIDKPTYQYSIRLNPRYRFSNKFQMIYSLDYANTFDEKAYVNNYDDDVYFGNRNTKEIVNSLSTQLNLNNKMAFALSLRYYWAPVNYDSQYYFLENDGTLSLSEYINNHDKTLNSWNFDLSYTWEFAPGSQLVALYRNDILDNTERAQVSFFRNINNLHYIPATNQLSLKLIYYLDYNRL